VTAQSIASRIAARNQSPALDRGALLERVSGRWQLELRAAVQPLDLTPAQFRLLVATAWLNASGAATRQSEIAAHANSDAVVTSEVLRTLEARDLIRREPHPTDRRAKAISVTETGAALADRAMRIVESVESRFFETGMSEFGVLAKALKKGGRGKNS